MCVYVWTGYVVEGEELLRQEECSLSALACREELKQTTSQLHYLKNMAFERLGIASDHGWRDGAAGGAGRTGSREGHRPCSTSHSDSSSNTSVHSDLAAQAQASHSDTDNTTASADCAVCMESLREGENEGEGGSVCVLSCGHEFHKECVDWILERCTNPNTSNSSKNKRRKKQLKCPVCRVVSVEEEIIEAAVTVRRTNAKLTESSTSSTSSTSPTSSVPQSLSPSTLTLPRSSSSVRSSASRVQGDWGAKITAVVEDLLALKQSVHALPLSATPGESELELTRVEKPSLVYPELDQKESSGFDTKSIVFSQWDQMLDICAAALQRNGIECEKIGGQSNTSKRHFEQSLTRFQCDPFVSVLLLPLKSGAQGLTLVEATHVFFLEPLLNLEQESQAVNRVHRIGQEYETCVHKYIMRNTVEEHIHRLYEERVQKECKLSWSHCP